MTQFITETDNISPSEALELAKKAKQAGCTEVAVRAENEKDASLLYMAGSHVGLRVTGVAYTSGKTVRLSWKVKKMAKAEWNDFIKDHKSSPEIFMMKDCSSQPSRRTPSCSIGKLDGLTGLGPVKKQVNDVLALQKMMQKRRKNGLPDLDISQHMIFTGNPGTGKTTVARIIGDIYSELGILKKGHFIEIDGRGLIAEYVGQTAEKTREIVTSAIDGILFIDEAYALAPKGNKNDYGHEAISTLIKMMEDNRNRLVVIMAGYDHEMEYMMNSNPGLKSRFKTKIHFPDYSGSELVDIFVGLCQQYGYALSEQAHEKTGRLFAALHENRGKNFGNGRSVRNCFDRTVTNQAIRIEREGQTARRKLELICEVDIPDVTDIEW